MPDQLQLRGGTTTEHNSFTGAAREVTVDTTKKTLVVHDGSQAGGTPLMKESGGNAASTVQIGVGGSNKLTINSDGHIDIASNLDCAAGLDVTGGGLTVNSGTTNTCATFTSTDSGAVVNITDSHTRSSIEQNNTDLKIISDTDAGDADSTIKFQVDSSTKMTLNHNGKLLLGHSTARPVAGNTERTIQIEATDAAASLSITRNSANTGGPFLSLGKSRASSVSGTTIVNDGDFLGTISFAGADGTDLITRGADIIAQVDGTPGGNDMPGRLLFSTTPDGGSSPVERMRISQNGNVTMPHQACMVFTNPVDVTNPSENTPLQFSGLDVSKGGMAESNTRSRITVPTTGTYLISALVAGTIITAASTDGVEFHLRKNGSIFPSSAVFPITSYGSTAGDEYYIDYTIILNLTANDYLEVALTNIDTSQADVQRGYFAVALIS